MLALIVFSVMLYVTKRFYEKGLREGYEAGIKQTSIKAKEEGYEEGYFKALDDSGKNGVVINSQGMFLLGGAKVTQ